MSVEYCEGCNSTAGRWGCPVHGYTVTSPAPIMHKQQWLDDDYITFLHAQRDAANRRIAELEAENAKIRRQLSEVCSELHKTLADLDITEVPK